MASESARRTSKASEHYGEQAQRLAHRRDNEPDDGVAVTAEFVTPHDPIIITAEGGRLPGVPLAEAKRLNRLKDETLGIDPEKDPKASIEKHKHRDNSRTPPESLGKSLPPSQTDPLFPPLPLYGPPTLLRNIQCTIIRVTSFCLSFSFLMVIVLGSAFTSIPLMFKHVGIRLTGKNPNARRPFYEEEVRRQKARKEAAKAWERKKRRRGSKLAANDDEDVESLTVDGYQPTEGGKDRLVCDIKYYARRVGLDVEEFKVQTEDGFILCLWHVYDPREYSPAQGEERSPKGPDAFPVHPADDRVHEKAGGRTPSARGNKKYPVLLIHGLLQSAGTYCTNDDDSLAFYLCKSGYDVWLGNNRCGFKPEHTLLSYSDPRMWAWNIRQMGVLDLPAFTSRVLSETGFGKLGLVCHSQGTTEAFVALAKKQRPDLGEKISVFCALAPAVYAGPLISKMYFKFMRIISPSFFRIFFGIHAFIPFMMTMHSLLPGTLYGALGYRVFSFLFDWTDDRWDLGLRDRCFQFAPVYVSSESMRWWLGRECFAKQKCILATKEEGKQEEAEDSAETEMSDSAGESQLDLSTEKYQRRVAMAWYNRQFPPLALWIAGSDDLVDGRKLLRRFHRGREPLVRLVHAKVINEYEHLDVLWAMDAVEKVHKEVKEVIWKTVPEDVREDCRVPRGCQELEFLTED